MNEDHLVIFLVVAHRVERLQIRLESAIFKHSHIRAPHFIFSRLVFGLILPQILERFGKRVGLLVQFGRVKSLQFDRARSLIEFKLNVLVVALGCLELAYGQRLDVLGVLIVFAGTDQNAGAGKVYLYVTGGVGLVD